MNLYALHRLLIVVAMLFCAGFALRGVVQIAGGHRSTTTLVLALFSGAASVGLALYLRWFRRKRPLP